MAETDEEGNELFDDKDREELEKGVHKLETLLENAVDKNFDRFELYVLRNILNVDPALVGWVRLAHHEVSYSRQETPHVFCEGIAN